jgi:hypothetical protein
VQKKKLYNSAGRCNYEFTVVIYSRSRVNYSDRRMHPSLLVFNLDCAFRVTTVVYVCKSFVTAATGFTLSPLQLRYDVKVN